MSYNAKPPKETNIYFNISSSNPHVLEGLDQWLKLGLFSQQEVKEIAKNHLKCDTNYYINHLINKPNFLEGLEVGLNLGLISETEVKEIAQTYLVCLYDYSIRKPVNIPIQQERRKPVIKTPPPPKKPSVMTTFFTSFKEELSVRWLLFLGVFLVVLSSGVLAASQWDKFPVFAQYGVLLSYTLVFWGVGFYSAKQENLKLTAQTLQTITLLLTPVNFWAIDTFGLWHSFLGGLIATIAIFLLTGITLISNAEKAFLPLVINFLGLSLLHLGWEIDRLSLVAVYIGMIGTAINLRFILPRQFQSTLGHKPLTLIKTSFVSYGLAILLIRAIFVVNIPIFQLGLAIGICGWLLTLEALGKNGLIFTTNKQQNEQNNLQSPVNQGLEITGAILMLFGWLLTLNDQPIQAILISGLALHWLTQRLTTYWLQKDLFWLFIIGLQAIILIRNIIPDNFKQNALNLSVEIANSHQYPLTVFGVTLFPYLIFFVWLTGWLYQKDQAKLARFGEYLTLSFGICLTLISLYNPTWLTLNLILSTLSLIYINFRYQNKITSLIYFTHLTGIFTLISCLHWLFPQLSLRENIKYWGVIFLAIMIIELTLSILPFHVSKFKEEKAFQSAKIWFNSCWYFGLILAIITYLIFLSIVNSSLNNYWFLLWALTPLTLTLIASQSPSEKRAITAIYSSISLILLQTLTISDQAICIISLALAIGLMFINIRYFPHLFFTSLHFAFGISLITIALWDYLLIPQWLILGSSLSLIFWISETILQQKQGKILPLYATSANGWAMTISSLIILSFTIRYFTYFSLNNSSNFFNLNGINYLISLVILLIAFTYGKRNKIINFNVYFLGWNVELLLVEITLLLIPSSLNIATINIIFSFITLILSYSLASKFPRLSNLISWHTLPLLYAIIGLIWRLELFNFYTGLLVIGASITAIGVSIKRKEWKFITYFALAGITLGCYEITIYQLLQKSGGSPADGLTILTFVTVAIALFYRLFVFIWHLRGKTYILNFNLQELILIAHFHWGLASILQLITIGLALESSPKLTYLSLIINFFLGTYAVIQARDNNINSQSSQSDWWVYVGLVEIIATFIYARLIFNNLQFLDPFQIIIVVLVALFIYQIPWQNLGWKETPWHRFALVSPALIALTNNNEISIFSLICVAIFYSRIAFRQKNIRWSYVSLGFIDWAIFLLFHQYVLNDPLWFISIISLSILYIAQFDPELIKPEYRKNRHNLRIFGSGLLTVSALIFHTQMWLIPVTISLIFIMIGLGVQIRAFLYVGTIVFMLTNFYQLVVLINQSSPSKWVIGFVTGIALIFVAAIFERKKETIFENIKNWFDQLEKWD